MVIDAETHKMLDVNSIAAEMEAAFRLEKMGSDGDVTNADEAYQVLEREIERLEPALLCACGGEVVKRVDKRR